MGVTWGDRRRVPSLPRALRQAEGFPPPSGPKRGARFTAGPPATDYQRLLDALARIHKEYRHDR